MRILITTILAIFFLFNPTNVFAIGDNIFCDTSDTQPNHGCSTGFFCKLLPLNPPKGTCEKDLVTEVFGKIQPPDALKGFLAKDPTGAGAISQFLSNAVTLIYSVSAVVLVFIFLWAAFEWMTSGGDKEKLASARGKLINGIIGIVLLALAFALIRIFGQFTGFRFFEGQNVVVISRDSQGIVTEFVCRGNPGVTFPANILTNDLNPDSFCEKHGW